MKSTDKFVLVLVASLSLLIAGCGGGGGGSSSDDMPPDTMEPTGPTQAEIDAANAATVAANDAATAATDAATAATDAATAATDAAGAAELADPAAASAAATAATDAATAATDAATAATDAANAVMAGDQATVDAATAAATAATDAATAATDAAMAANDAASALNTAEAEAQDAAEAARMAAAREEAMRVAGLIGPTPKLADANAQAADNQSIVTLSTPAADDNFSLPVFATVASDGTSTPVKFTASGMPTTIDGWTGGVYTHTSEDGNTMHKVTKYNDKAADKAEAYSTFFSTANAGSTTHRAGVAVTAVDGNGVLTIDVAAFSAGDTDKIRNNHGLFTGNFGPTTEGTYNFPGVGKVTGTFRGVPGTFDCPSSCASTHDKDGNLTALSGTWTFEPDGVRDAQGSFLTDNTGDADPTNDTALTDALAAIMVPGVKQDADYMILGFWEQSVTDDDDVTTETMLPFADGKRDYGTVNPVQGSAKYAGPATGLYMMKTLTRQGIVDQEGTFTSGQFTADAMLTANFGGGNVAVNHQYSITGTISNFMDGDSAIDGDWEVNLNRTMLAGTDTVLGTDDDTPQKNIYATGNTTGDGDGSSGMFGGVTHGGALDDPSNAGSWSGTFHGDTAANTENAAPASASGIFDAHFTNGHVRGAFAADKQ